MSRTRLAGIFYLVTFVAGAAALALRGPVALTANAIATAAYVAVAWLFFGIFAPVSRPLSQLALVVGMAGCAAAAAGMLGLRLPVNPLALFGGYCLLVGTLIVRSDFVPRVLGVLMAAGGLSWLTFGIPTLAGALAPYNFAPGILAEGALTAWLLTARPRAR